MARTRKPDPALAKSATVEELPVACSNEAAAVEFLERQRWGDCPCCAHCGSTGVYKMTDRATGQRSKRFLWRCKDCKKQYTVRVGTIYSESAIELHKWVRAFWEASACKNGISALELSRKIQVSYKSALFLMHRIRHAMADTTGTAPKLTGTVEADETFWGGKPRYPGPFSPRGSQGKPVIFAVVERGGAARCNLITSVRADNVMPEIEKHVDKSARVMTDEHGCYTDVPRVVKGGHFTVAHSRREYVKKGTDIHSNTVEGFFSRVKRTLHGTYHAVSKQHFNRYLNQIAFVYSNRHLNDGDRTVLAIRGAVGKRLVYRQPIIARKRPI